MKHWYSEWKDFFFLWFGQSISQLGSRMTAFALVLWSYERAQTVTSVAVLALCSYLPEMLFTFLGGSVADRVSRKAVMFLSDLTAALGTLTLLLVMRADALEVWHLYATNLLVGMTNAFQSPASNAALSQIVPPRHYSRASGMQSFSTAANTLVCPALASAVMAFGGLEWVLLIDLTSFLVGAGMLLALVHIPRTAQAEKVARGGTMDGFRFLRLERPALLRLILFFTFVNLLASMSGNGLMPAMILARTGGDELAVGTVSSFIGLGTLMGSVLATVLPRPRRPLRLVFFSCAVSFLLCDCLWALGRRVEIWAFAALAGNLPLPLLNANLTTLLRTSVPMDRQGRVFAAQGALQFCSIPLGYLMGGLLSDYLAEPFMRAGGPVAERLVPLVGSGAGSGMALLFLLVGLLGAVSSFVQIKNRAYIPLEKEF